MDALMVVGLLVVVPWMLMLVAGWKLVKAVRRSRLIGRRLRAGMPEKVRP